MKSKASAEQKHINLTTNSETAKKSNQTDETTTTSKRNQAKAINIK
jgi:hypothetical protein